MRERVVSRARSVAARLWNGAPEARDAVRLAALGLVVRAGVIAWAGTRFPPAEDGRFYAIVAGRIAEGLGYTWLWPDGAVTYAAHYPVGYPALIGGLYALFGPHPLVAMGFNAAIGSAGVWSVYRVATETGRRGPALLAGLIAALHPGFVFYTPALMTEGVTAALLAILAALAVVARTKVGAPRLAVWTGAGLVAGLLALIRPQTIVLAPVFGALAASRGWRDRAFGAALVTGLAFAMCLPWTLRNCARFDQCVFVSANGGWNLFIGSAPGATGRWVPIDVLGVPQECKTVFGEAEKDRCFGSAALRLVEDDPLRWLRLMPKKLAATFDWSGAPGHYLNASNGTAFDSRRKLALGILEAVVERVVVLFALVGMARAVGPRRRARVLAGVIGAAFLFQEHAWVAYSLFVLGVLLGGEKNLWERPALTLGMSVVAATALTHAVFFGDGRYGLVTGLVLVMAAAEAFRPGKDGIGRLVPAMVRGDALAGQRPAPG